MSSTTQNNNASGKVTLSPFPGEDPLRHTGKAWIESTQSVLASHNLLTVANGGPHPDAAKIIDTPESDFLDVGPQHHDFYRIHADKRKAWLLKP